jgi:hypothetical protein
MGLGLLTMIALIALAAGLQLPPQLLEIASKIAGEGKPGCTSYQVDGTIGPCMPAFEIESGDRPSGRGAGSRITFTQAATVKLTADEFALLAGHEVAHYYLGHRESNPPVELAADRLGAQIACQAGFDPAAGASLFRFFASGKTHPPRGERRAAVLGVVCNFQRPAKKFASAQIPVAKLRKNVKAVP